MSALGARPASPPENQTPEQKICNTKKRRKLLSKISLNCKTYR